MRWARIAPRAPANPPAPVAHRRRHPRVLQRFSPGACLGPAVRCVPETPRLGCRVREFGLTCERTRTRMFEGVIRRRAHPRPLKPSKRRKLRSPDRVGLITLTGTVLAPRPNRGGRAAVGGGACNRSCGVPTMGEARCDPLDREATMVSAGRALAALAI